MLLVIKSWLLLLWPADEWRRNSYTPIRGNLQWPVQRQHVSWQWNLQISWWDKIHWKLPQQQVKQYKINPWSQWQPYFICKHMQKKGYLWFFCRLEGDGEFTDSQGLLWTGMFHNKAALGLKLKVNMWHAQIHTPFKWIHCETLWHSIKCQRCLTESALLF